MTEYTFTLNNRDFTIPHDLGPELNSEITKFYAHFLMGQSFDCRHFNSVVIEYFNSHVGKYQAHDDFFTNLVPPWGISKTKGRLLEARRVWETALSPAFEWEKANSSKFIHKGTPYYFLAVTAILSGDLDLGFLLMHQALDEDVRATDKPLPITPASSLVTLNYDNPKQYFREEVRDTAKFLGEFLATYRNTYGSVLTLDKFRNRLFNIPDLIESFFLLVFTLFKFKSLIRKIDPNFRKNKFAGLIEIGTLFDLCLVIDSVLQHKSAIKHNYREQIKFLSNYCRLSLGKGRLKEINNAFDRDFSAGIDGLLNGTWTFEDGNKLSLPEVDLALSYGLRNFSAHRIESIPVIYEHIEDIFQHIINVLFLSVETLYKTSVSNPLAKMKKPPI